MTVHEPSNTPFLNQGFPHEFGQQPPFSQVTIKMWRASGFARLLYLAVNAKQQWWAGSLEYLHPAWAKGLKQEVEGERSANSPPNSTPVNFTKLQVKKRTELEMSPNFTEM